MAKLRYSFAALAVFSSLLFGQTTSNSIIGSVTDGSGLAMAGAKVSILNTRTGVRAET